MVVLTRVPLHRGCGEGVSGAGGEEGVYGDNSRNRDLGLQAEGGGEGEPHWSDIDFWTEMWLTPGSVVMHNFSLGGGGCGGGDRLQEIAKAAKSISEGNIFAMCAASALGGGHERYPPVFVSIGGLTVRVHPDGTYTPEREIDPEFRARTSLRFHAVCCSPVVRYADFAVSG